jgi:hypothetical protein
MEHLIEEINSQLKNLRSIKENQTDLESQVISTSIKIIFAFLQPSMVQHHKMLVRSMLEINGSILSKNWMTLDAQVELNNQLNQYDPEQKGNEDVSGLRYDAIIFTAAILNIPLRNNVESRMSIAELLPKIQIIQANDAYNRFDKSYREDKVA